jgi:hypothetical protein
MREDEMTPGYCRWFDDKIGLCVRYGSKFCPNDCKDYDCDEDVPCDVEEEREIVERSAKI